MTRKFVKKYKKGLIDGHDIGVAVLTMALSFISVLVMSLQYDGYLVDITEVLPKMLLQTGLITFASFILIYFVTREKYYVEE